MKKKRWKILISVLIALLAALGVAAFIQRENLKAIIVGTQYTSQELEQQMTESRQAVQSVLDATPDITVRVPTDEEKQKLREGSLTEEELIRILTEKPEGAPRPQPPTGAASQPESAEVAPPAGEPAAPTAPQPSAEETYQQQLSLLIAKIYVLREQYLNLLEETEAEAREAYSAMSAEERTTLALTKWVSGYVSRVTEMEKECDRQVDEIVTEMAKLVRSNHGELDIVDQVVYGYANEKSLKKSWYLSKLEERGLLS